jgi:hypothetical protein
VLGDEPLLATTGKEPQYAEQFHNQEKRLGLPNAQLTPDERAKRLKPILHEMAEAGKLIFIPPDHWKVRQ